MELFPAIDLRDGKVVRLLKGDYDQQTTYDMDPLSQAKAFEAAGAKWLHLVDLGGARSGQMTHIQIIKQICEETDLKVEVGGGVRTEGAIDALLSVGVERVILGTAAFEKWSWFESLMTNPTYRGRLVLGLDARKGAVAIHGWEKQLEASAIEIAKQVTQWPLAAIVYTDIATDGTLKGPNVEATREIAEATNVPVVASGGVGDMSHIKALKDLPIEGVIVGRAIYEGTVDTAEAVAHLRG